MSPSLKRFVTVFGLSDSFRCLPPDAVVFSRYYSTHDNDIGATRIDRAYHYGDISVKEAEYVEISFSDHHSLIVKVQLPQYFSRLLSPKARPYFKSKPEVVKDGIFQARLRIIFQEWLSVKNSLGIMIWWEELVKPGIRKLLIERGKEINREKRGKLNLLLIRQAYLVRKLHL